MVESDAELVLLSVPGLSTCSFAVRIGYGAIPTSRIDDGLALLNQSFKPQ
jgi:hypothetical protein